MKLNSVLISIAGVAGVAMAICLLVYAVSIGKAYFFEQAAIDRCIDSGGAWGDEGNSCRR